MMIEDYGKNYFLCVTNLTLVLFALHHALCIVIVSIPHLCEDVQCCLVLTFDVFFDWMY